MSWVAAIVGGVGALAGGIFGGQGAQAAASAQANASMYAARIGQQEFNTITEQESPFMQAGYSALSGLESGLGIGPNTGAPMPGGGSYGSLLTPFTADYMQQYSPAYQFQAEQGRQGTLNGDTSGAGALSGAAQKDLMGFNQGFANTAFSNAFNQYQTQQGNIYQRLAGLTQLGQAAAANTGQQGTALAGQIGQAVTNAGTATAGGIIGATNAYTGALGNLSYMPWLYSQNPGAQPGSAGMGTELPSE